MILLNTTFYVHYSVDLEFHKWVKEIYFPSALSAKGISSPVFARLMLEPQEGMTGYAVQLSVSSRDVGEEWHDGVAASLREDLLKEFSTKVLFFTTYMEVLEL